MSVITIILPFYRQPQMLIKQLSNWRVYSAAAREYFELMVIDDGSPEPASDIVKASDGVQLYRVAEDIPWHRNPCRNLGATLCETPWMIQTDLDHILPPESADALLETAVNPKRWYRFSRWRVGMADETRMKDAIPRACTFGRVKEHGDSYLITRDLFLKSPYDQAYSGGFLGGGSPFLKRMESIAPVELLPDDVALHVYTRHVIPDASITTLSRDTSTYSKIRKEKERRGDTVPKMNLDFEWSRVF